uniref:Double jelly roll-like domain-containing protein n=1 Tax=Glossina pallidipes TaxID=7398 RepID=A0A1A9ZSP5_GLOPL
MVTQMPNKDDCILNFKNFKHPLDVTFGAYADFIFILEPVDIQNSTNIKSIRKHIPFAIAITFSSRQFSLLYDMYLLKRVEFMTFVPIVVLDVTQQNNSFKTGPIDIRIQLKTSSNIPSNKSAYCLIIHDKEFDYAPRTNEIYNLFYDDYIFKHSSARL